MKQSRAESFASRNEAAGAIANERGARHTFREQRNFYYAAVVASASSGQAYVGHLPEHVVHVYMKLKELWSYEGLVRGVTGKHAEKRRGFDGDSIVKHCV